MRTFSKTTTLKQIAAEMRKLFNVDENKKCQLWGDFTALDEKMNQNYTIGDANLTLNCVTLGNDKNEKDMSKILGCF